MDVLNQSCLGFVAFFGILATWHVGYLLNTFQILGSRLTSIKRIVDFSLHIYHPWYSGEQKVYMFVFLSGKHVSMLNTTTFRASFSRK